MSLEINKNIDYTTKTSSTPAASTTSTSTAGSTSTTGSTGASIFIGTSKTTGTTQKTNSTGSTDVISTTSSTGVTFTTETATATATAVNTKTSEKVSTTTIAEVSETITTGATKETKPVEESLVEKYAAQNGYEDKTVDDVIALIKRKAMDAELTDEEKAIITEFEQTKKTDVNPEEAQKIEEAKKVDEEYAKFRSSGGTAYENTTKALDRYLSDNDEKYQNLTDDKEKRAYRDGKLHDLLKVFVPDAKTRKNGTLKLTDEQRAVALIQISSLCAISAKEGTSLDELSKLPLEELVSKVNKQEVAQMQAIAQKLDLGNTEKTADQKMYELADLYFSKTDAEYNKLSADEKEGYILNKSSEMLSDVLGMNVSSEDLKPGKSMFLKESALALFNAMAKKGIPVTEFVNLSAQKQAQLIMEVKNKTPNLEEKLSQLPEKERKDAEVFFARTEIIASVDKQDGKVTDRDVLAELEKLRKQGKLSEGQEILYKELSQLKYTKLLDNEAKVTSNVGKALLLGVSAEDLIRSQMKHLDANRIRKDLGSDKLNPRMKELMDGVAADKSFTQFKVLREELLKLGLSEKEIKQYFEKYDLDYAKMGQLSTAAAAARNNGEEVGEVSNFVVTNCTNDEIQDYSVSVKVAVRYLDDTQTANAIINFNSTNETILNAYNTGCHEYKSVDSCLTIANTVANSNNVSNECKSSYTKSFITTAPAKNQVYYCKELGKTGNPAVIEGLAAAEPYVDPSVKSQYSSHLDNAINNSNLSDSQKSDIQQARQTGQTSYERSALSSSDERQAQSASNSNKTPANTSSYNQSPRTEGVRTASPTSGISNTSATRGVARTSNASGISSYAKVSDSAKNYGDEVSKALNDKKTATLERLSGIIDNYQKSVKAQDSAKAKEVKGDKSADTSIKQDAAVEKALTEVKGSGSVSVEAVAELKSAYSSGGVVALFDKLSSVGGSSMQDKFLAVLAKYSDSNTLQNFASQYSSDPNVILSLYQYSNNPLLLSYLNESSTMDLLAKGKIKMKDFLKYASPASVALYISDLRKTGNTDLLRQIFGMLNLSQESYVKQHVTQMGGDDWMAQLSDNMSRASGKHQVSIDDGIALGSDKVPMRGDYDRMKQRGPFYFTA